MFVYTYVRKCWYIDTSENIWSLTHQQWSSEPHFLARWHCRELRSSIEQLQNNNPVLPRSSFLFELTSGFYMQRMRWRCWGIVSCRIESGSHQLIFFSAPEWRYQAEVGREWEEGVCARLPDYTLMRITVIPVQLAGLGLLLWVTFTDTTLQILTVNALKKKK